MIGGHRNLLIFLINYLCVIWVYLIKQRRISGKIIFAISFMKIDAAYYYGVEVLKKDRDIIPAQFDYFVLSAGSSRPITRDYICTVHPPRRDYQLIYAHNGPIHYFDKDGTEHIAPAGSFLLYKPLEFQKYVVYKEENTVYYWCHFGGTKIEQFLKEGVGMLDSLFYHVWEQLTITLVCATICVVCDYVKFAFL